MRPAKHGFDEANRSGSRRSIDASPSPRRAREVVTLEEQARMQRWPHVRAVPQRALLLLRILPCAGTRGATMSANKSVNHVADDGSDHL